MIEAVVSPRNEAKTNPTSPSAVMTYTGSRAETRRKGSSFVVEIGGNRAACGDEQREHERNDHEFECEGFRISIADRLISG